MKYTNEKTEKQRLKYKFQNKSTLSSVSLIELKALLGLIILAASLQNNHLSSSLLFDSSYCGDRYLATISKERFNFLVNCLRFDSKEKREDRQTQCKFAAISQVWEKFLTNRRKNYKPAAYVTIHEQIVGFRGNCPFRIYIPSKPDNYGIELVMMCDNTTKYMVDAQ